MLPEDAKLFLSFVPTEGKINNKKLQALLKWPSDKFQLVRNELLSIEKIESVVGGVGGATALNLTKKPKKVEKQPEVFDFSKFASDEEALMSLIPADGMLVMKRAYHLLEWDHERMTLVKQSLIKDNKVVSIRGGIRLFVEGDSFYAEPVEKEKFDSSVFASDEEAFLSFFSNQEPLSIRKVQSQLNWDKERFLNVKQKLVKENKIVVAKGAIRRFDGNDTPYKEKKYEEPIEETPATLNSDFVVYVGLRKDLVPTMINRLKETGYPHQTFYAETDEDNTIVIKMRRRYPVPLSRDTFERLCEKATAAAQFALETFEEPTEEKVMGNEQ